MTNDEMKDSLHQGMCKVVFTKKNGDERIMHCTLQESMLPEQMDIEEEIQKELEDYGKRVGIEPVDLNEDLYDY